MKNFFYSVCAVFFLFSYPTPGLQAEIETKASSPPPLFQSKNSDIRPSPEDIKPENPTPPLTRIANPAAHPIPSPTVVTKFQPFTGKITKNKVRMRLQSTYDGTVLREFNRNDLVVVLGETDDFYAVQPPADFRAFVFRTYVLDNVIEGNRVNVRLKPELEAPVVAQLNSGDRVEGFIHPTHNKWLEIKLPEATRFYIAKEYVEKAGDVNFKARLEKKYNDVNQLLQTTTAMGQTELQKPFEQINLEGIKKNYQHIMFDFPEFPEVSLKAKETLVALQEAYTNKKLAFLEQQSRASSTAFEVNKKLAAELNAQKNKVSHLEQQIEQNRQISTAPSSISAPSSNPKPTQLPINMSLWLPVEEKLFHAWSQKNNNPNPKDFYDEQQQNSFILKGIVDSYHRPIKNKPGDYMLINSASKLPVAFLYSTHINLQDYIGHEVSLRVNPRTNNDFAFPAYFVLKLE